MLFESEDLLLYNNIDIKNKYNNEIKETKNQKMLREDCERILLSEAYFGKNPLLEDCERQLDIIIKKIKKNPFYIASDSKENKRICANLERLFNVETCTIIWNPDITESNAFTFPLTQLLQFKNDLKTVRNKNGVKFVKKDGLHLLVYIQNAIVSNINDITPNLLMATILHEIGHNFYTTDFALIFNKYIATYGLLNDLLKSFLSNDKNKQTEIMDMLSFLILKTNTGRNFTRWFSMEDNILTKTAKIGHVVRGLFKMHEHFSIFSDRIISLYQGRKFLLNRLKSAVKITKSSLVSELVVSNTLLKSYEQERFSDTFASMYGYGPEIAKFRVLFEENKNRSLDLSILHKIKPIYYSLVYIDTFLQFPFKILSSYDNGLQAANSQLEYLEKELSNTGYPPQVKKEIQEKINEIKKIQEYALSKEHNLKTANIFRLLFGRYTANLNINATLNKSTYFLQGKQFDTSFEDIIDKKQMY